MKMKTKLFLSMLYVILAMMFVQNCQAQSKPSALIEPPAPEYEVSIASVTNIPMVEVMLNGQGPFKLILDTGSADTIISPKVAQQLNVDITAQDYAAPTVSGTIKMRGVENLNIKLDGTNYHKTLNALTLEKHSPNTTQIEKVFSIADGVLGLNFFCNSTLSIDGPRQTLTVGPSSYPEPYRIKKSRNCYYLDNDTSFRPTISTKMFGKIVSIFADTGDVVNGEITFNSTPVNDEIWREVSKNYGLVTAKRFSGKRLKITGAKNVKFGNETAKANVVILLVDPNEDSTPYAFYKDKTANKALDAIMGWKLLKKGVLTIDANSPDESSFTFSKPFNQEYSKSGFRKAMFTTPSTLLVQEIAIKSPANLAGIREGDIITHINNRAVSNTEFFWLKDTIYGKNGSTLHIKFKRGQKQMSKTILLYDYLFEQK